MSRTPTRRPVGYGADASSFITPQSSRNTTTGPRVAHPPSTPRPNNSMTADKFGPVTVTPATTHTDRSHTRELDEMKKVSSNMERIQAACSGLILSSDVALASIQQSEVSRQLVNAAELSFRSQPLSSSSLRLPVAGSRRPETPTIQEQIRLALVDCASVGPAMDNTGRTATDTLTDILTRLQDLKMVGNNHYNHNSMGGGTPLEGSIVTPLLNNSAVPNLTYTTPQLNSLVLPSSNATRDVAALDDTRYNQTLPPTSTPQRGNGLGVSLIASDVTAGITTRSGGGYAGGNQSPARRVVPPTQTVFDSSVDPSESIWPDISSAQLALHEILLTTRSNDPALSQRASLGGTTRSQDDTAASYQSIRASCRKAMMALYDATQGHAAVLRQRDQLSLSSAQQESQAQITGNPNARRVGGGFIVDNQLSPNNRGGGSSSPPDYLLCVAFDRPKRLRSHLIGSIYDSVRDTLKKFLKAAVSRSQTGRFVSEDHEGTAFILSFSSSLECVAFDYCIQRYAMYLPWPTAALELSYAHPVASSAEYAAKASICAGKEMDWVNEAGRRIDQRGAANNLQKSSVGVNSSSSRQGSSTPPPTSRSQSPGTDLNHSQGSMGGGGGTTMDTNYVVPPTTTPHHNSSSTAAPAGSFTGGTTGGTFSSFEVKEIRIARAKLAALEQMFCVQVELLNGSAEERAQQAALRLLRQEQEATRNSSSPLSPDDPQKEEDAKSEDVASTSMGSSIQEQQLEGSGLVEYDDDGDPTEVSFLHRPPILPPEATAAQIAAAFQTHYSSFSQRGPQIRSAIHFSSAENSSLTAPFNVPQATVSGLCGLSLDGTTLSAAVIDRADMKVSLEAVGGFMWEHSLPEMECCERDRIEEYGSSASRNTKETRLLCLMDLQEFCGVYRGYSLHYHRGRQCPSLVTRQSKFKKAATTTSSSKSISAIVYPPRVDTQFYDDTINEALLPSTTSISSPGGAVKRRKSSSVFCPSSNPAREGTSESYNPWWWCSDLPSINALAGGEHARILAIPTRSQACQTIPVQVVQLDEDGKPAVPMNTHRRSRARSSARSISPRESSVSRKSLFASSTTLLSPPTRRQTNATPNPGSSMGNRSSKSPPSTPMPVEPAVPTEAQIEECAEKLIAARLASIKTADSGAQTNAGSYDRYPQSRLCREYTSELLHNPHNRTTKGDDNNTETTGGILSLDQVLSREVPAPYGYEGFTDTMAAASAELLHWVNNNDATQDVAAEEDAVVQFVSGMIMGVVPPRGGGGGRVTRPSLVDDSQSFAGLIKSTLPTTTHQASGRGGGVTVPPTSADVVAYRSAVLQSGPAAITAYGLKKRIVHSQRRQFGPDPASLYRPADRGWEEVAKLYTQRLSSYSCPGVTASDASRRDQEDNTNMSQRGSLQLEFRSEDAAVSRAVVASVFHAVSQLREDFTRKLEYQRVVATVALEEAYRRVEALEESLEASKNAAAMMQAKSAAVAVAASSLSIPAVSLGTSVNTESFGGGGSCESRTLFVSPSTTPRPSTSTPKGNRRPSKATTKSEVRTPRPPR